MTCCYTFAVDIEPYWCNEITNDSIDISIFIDIRDTWLLETGILSLGGVDICSASCCWGAQMDDICCWNTCKWVFHVADWHSCWSTARNICSIWEKPARYMCSVYCPHVFIRIDSCWQSCWDADIDILRDVTWILEILGFSNWHNVTGEGWYMSLK